MEFDEEARARIARALRARRAELGMSQEAVARASGGLVSTASLRVMEGAGRATFRSRSIVGVTRALGWPADAFGRIAAGEPAIEADEAPANRRPVATVDGVELATVAHLDLLRDEIAALRAELALHGDRLGGLVDRLQALESSTATPASRPRS